MWMTNPILPDNPPVQVDAQTFRLVWKPRGWQASDPPPDDQPTAPEPAEVGGLSHATAEPASTSGRKRKES